jgi:very-short-patch-repair endonuclease
MEQYSAIEGINIKLQKSMGIYYVDFAKEKRTHSKIYKSFNSFM